MRLLNKNKMIKEGIVYNYVVWLRWLYKIYEPNSNFEELECEKILKISQSNLKENLTKFTR